MKNIKGTWFPDYEHHMPDQPEFKEQGTYQKPTYDLAQQYVSQQGIALDIGAHVGFFTRYMAADYEVVYAFEPVQEHFDCLEANIEFLYNVIIQNVALGDKHQTVGMVSDGMNSGATHIGGDGDIPMKTLDDYIPKLIDPADVNYVKIDVEGYEPQVLLGGEKFFREGFPVVQIEQKRDRYKLYGKKDPREILEDWGYMCIASLRADFIYIKPQI